MRPGLVYAVGAGVMGVSVVIAAWGEGVNVCLCPPSPSTDRSSFAQNARKKCWLGSSSTTPLAVHAHIPPALN
jgi:hypothetical protein